MAIKFLDSCSSFTVMNSILTGVAYARRSRRNWWSSRNCTRDLASSLSVIMFLWVVSVLVGYEPCIAILNIKLKYRSFGINDGLSSEHSSWDRSTDVWMRVLSYTAMKSIGRGNTSVVDNLGITSQIKTYGLYLDFQIEMGVSWTDKII